MTTLSPKREIVPTQADRALAERLIDHDQITSAEIENAAQLIAAHREEAVAHVSRLYDADRAVINDCWRLVDAPASCTDLREAIRAIALAAMCNADTCKMVEMEMEMESLRMQNLRLIELTKHCAKELACENLEHYAHEQLNLIIKNLPSVWSGSGVI